MNPNPNPNDAAEPDDRTSVLQLTAPGSGLTTTEPWSQQLHDQWTDTVEQADRYNWQIAARYEPGPRTLRADDRIDLCNAAMRTMIRWEKQQRLTCPHIIDAIVPSILLDTEPLVEVCMRERCALALKAQSDAALFHGEHCSICGPLDTPSRLDTICLPILFGHLIMVVCEHHLELKSRRCS